MLALLVATSIAAQITLYQRYEATVDEIVLFARGLSKGLVGEDLGQDIG